MKPGRRRWSISRLRPQWFRHRPYSPSGLKGRRQCQSLCRSPGHRRRLRLAPGQAAARVDSGRRERWQAFRRMRAPSWREPGAVVSRPCGRGLPLSQEVGRDSSCRSCSRDGSRRSAMRRQCHGRERDEGGSDCRQTTVRSRLTVTMRLCFQRSRCPLSRPPEAPRRSLREQRKPQIKFQELES